MTQAATLTTAAFDLLWGAWHGDEPRRFDCPPTWNIHNLRMADAPALTATQVRRALQAPIDAVPLTVLAQDRRSAAIAIDDITRPTQTVPLLRQIVDLLEAGGIPPAAVTVVLATGAHRRATSRDLALKVDPAAMPGLRVVSHDPANDLVDTGRSLGGVPVRVNRAFATAELRLAITGVMPHPFAGFSGGGKIVVPGLADLDVVARTHKFALMGLKGGAALEGNRFRAEMEAAVEGIGLHWTANVAVNSRRETAFLAAGHFVAAHRAAAAAAARFGATAPPTVKMDALVLNAYPKDGELLQIESAFVALRSGMLRWLAPGAPVILTGACPEGRGYHGLFGPGGRLFRTPSPRGFIAGHPLWIFAPGAPEAAIREIFPAEYPSFCDWNALIGALEPLLPRAAVVGVIPCGPLQVAMGELRADEVLLPSAGASE